MVGTLLFRCSATVTVVSIWFFDLIWGLFLWIERKRGVTQDRHLLLHCRWTYTRWTTCSAPLGNYGCPHRQSNKMTSWFCCVWWMMLIIQRTAERMPIIIHFCVRCNIKRDFRMTSASSNSASALDPNVFIEKFWAHTLAVLCSQHRNIVEKENGSESHTDSRFQSRPFYSHRLSTWES